MFGSHEFAYRSQSRTSGRATLSVKQKRLTDVDRRFGAVDHPPALPKGGGVEPAEFGELVRQASSP